jgi:hypothetical protein
MQYPSERSSIPANHDDDYRPTSAGQGLSLPGLAIVVVAYLLVLWLIFGDLLVN